jgi:putative ABC transport system permease protein
MQHWLQQFAYHIEISIWLFVVAGMLAILIALISVAGQAVRAAITNPLKSLRVE